MPSCFAAFFTAPLFSVAYNGSYLSPEAPALISALSSLHFAAAGPLGGLLREISAWLAFAPQNSFRHYLKMQYADQTFKGLYHWNWFDVCMLLPYFAVMILLSFYGVHRYTMCYQYFKYKKNYDPNPPRHFEESRQPDEPFRVLRQQVQIDARLVVEPIEVPRRNQFDEVPVPILVLAQQNHVVVPVRIRPRLVPLLRNVHLAPDHRVHSRRLGRVIMDAFAKVKDGKRVFDDLYIHRSLEDELPPLVRLMIFAGRQIVGDIGHNVIKLSVDGRKVSFLHYTNFDDDPHPSLRFLE